MLAVVAGKERKVAFAAEVKAVLHDRVARVVLALAELVADYKLALEQEE